MDAHRLAYELTTTVVNKAHPYMLYTDADVAKLREKIKFGLSEKAFATMKESADRYLTYTLTTPQESPTAGRQAQNYIMHLCVTGMLTGEEKYIQKAISFVMHSVDCIKIDAYDWGWGLMVGDYTHAIALGYDCLYQFFAEEQRIPIRAKLEELGEWIYSHAPHAPWGDNVDRRLAWNWSVVTAGALGLAALALGNKPEWLELSLYRAMGYLRCAVDDTGAGMEGLHYVGYGLNSVVPLDFAVYNLSGNEMMDEFEGIKNLPYWSMYMTLPFGGAQAAVGQGSEIQNYSTTYYIINRYKQSDALWGWEHASGIAERGGFESEYERIGWSLPAIVLFEDQSLIPKKPTTENNPLVKKFEKGIVIARDSWEKDASMVTFTCGYGWAGCWNHPDDNSFTFYAKGESFVIDLGPGPIGKVVSSDHNIVLVDGVGMGYVGGATVRVGILEENAILENGAVYLRGNNSTSYQDSGVLKHSVRHLIYGGGETPFVLIYDYAISDGNHHIYSTNFYTSCHNTVTISDDGGYGMIQGAESGENCYMIPYSSGGVVLSLEIANHGGKGIVTVSESVVHKQATLFITSNPDGSKPDVSFAEEGELLQVSITRVKERQRVTEIYELFDEKLVTPRIVTSTKPSRVPKLIIESIEAETRQFKSS